MIELIYVKRCLDWRSTLLTLVLAADLVSHNIANKRFLSDSHSMLCQSLFLGDMLQHSLTKKHYFDRYARSRPMIVL